MFDILVRSGIRDGLTRTEDCDPSLEARGGMAEGYDLFISQHSNEFNGMVRGVECFHSKTPSARTTLGVLTF